MEISGTYSSIQPVTKGDLVQLVVNKEGFVMKVYEKASFSYLRDDFNEIKAMSIFNEYLVTVRELNRGNIKIETFLKGVSIWSQTIVGLSIVDLSIEVGNAGIFLLFSGDGIITLSNGVLINKGPVRVLNRLELKSGNLIAYSIIQGALELNIIYDQVTNISLIAGNTNKPIVINGVTVINKNNPYSFIIPLSPTLISTQPLIVDNALIEEIAVGNSNIAYTVTINGQVELSFYSETSTWTKNLGAVKVLELEIYDNFVAVVAKDLVQNIWAIYQYTFDGIEINDTTLPVEGFIRLTKLAYNKDRFILYAIVDDRETNPTKSSLVEYDIYDDVIAWETPIDLGANFLTGDISLVSLGTNDNLTVYNKRLPALIGAVSQVLWPTSGQSGGTGCPPGFHPCRPGENPCTGLTGGTGRCCPDNVLPGCRLPYIVTVDFILTKAFAPVIPGQEYFMSTINKDITDVETGNRYIGTALDKERVLMLATGGLF